jgi:hypothetical protein
MIKDVIIDYHTSPETPREQRSLNTFGVHLREDNSRI